MELKLSLLITIDFCRCLACKRFSRWRFFYARRELHESSEMHFDSFLSRFFAFANKFAAFELTTERERKEENR